LMVAPRNSKQAMRLIRCLLNQDRPEFPDKAALVRESWASVVSQIPAVVLRRGRNAPSLWTTVTTGTVANTPLRLPLMSGFIGSSYGDGKPSRRFGQRNRDRPDAQRHPIRMQPGDRPPVLDILRSPSNVGLP